MGSSWERARLDTAVTLAVPSIPANKDETVSTHSSSSSTDSFVSLTLPSHPPPSRFTQLSQHTSAMPAIERAMPIPRSLVPAASSPSRSGSRSPRRVPSPLRNAQFRPLAMEYALAPQPTSCKYFNNGEAEEEPTQSEYCALVRTVG